MEANSERVQGTNFPEFCSKPLFRWILDTLVEVEEIDQVVINTDALATLAAARATPIESLTQAKANIERLPTERPSQIQQLTQQGNARDKQTMKADCILHLLLPPMPREAHRATE